MIKKMKKNIDVSSFSPAELDILEKVFNLDGIFEVEITKRSKKAKKSGFICPEIQIFLGRMLKLLRVNAGVTSQDIAEQIDTSRVSVHAYETTGLGFAGVCKLLKICRTQGYDIHKIIGLLMNKLDELERKS